MNKREKMVERTFFTREEKQQMLQKSNGLCAHCGKKVALGDNFTVEHAIPISKGSDNDFRNVVALCRDCNQDKANTVILKDIGNYYKYLNQESLLALIDYADEFCEKTDWFSWDNWYEDDQNIFTPDGIPDKKDWVKYKNSLRLTPKIVLKKATYNMLDSICEFYVKNAGCRRLSKSEQEVIKKNVGDCFLLGSIYLLQNSCQEILGVFCVCLNTFLEAPNTEFERELTLPFVFYPCVKKRYQEYLYEALNILISNVLDKCPNPIGGVMFRVMNNQKYAYDVVKNIRNTRLLLEEEDTTLFANYSFSTDTETMLFVKGEDLDKYILDQSNSYKLLVKQREKVLKRLLSYDNYNKLMGN